MPIQFKLCIFNLDFSENETLEISQNKILCDNNINVTSNEIKNKKRKKRKKKPNNTIIKCLEVEEVKQLLLQTIKEKDADALMNYLLLKGFNNSITQEHLDIGLNEAIDENNNTILHLASTNCLHKHI